jgi:CRISPR/Cas system-associated endonuclease Cas1
LFVAIVIIGGIYALFEKLYMDGVKEATGKESIHFFKKKLDLVYRNKIAPHIYPINQYGHIIDDEGKRYLWGEFIDQAINSGVDLDQAYLQARIQVEKDIERKIQAELEKSRSRYRQNSEYIIKLSDQGNLPRKDR